MGALASDITRRINIFGVSEPIVQTETGGEVGHTDYRLIVELPGVTNLTQAEAMIGKTPELDFMLVGSSTSATALAKASSTATSMSRDIYSDRTYRSTRQIGPSVQYDPTTYSPYVSLTFNDQGAALFDTNNKK